MICTKRKLKGEIERIKKMLLDNGYPKNVINAQITKEIAQFSTLKRFGPEKYPVYLMVAWIGKPSTNGKRNQDRRGKLPVARKNVLLTIQKSFVINEYKCHCDSRYVG